MIKFVVPHLALSYSNTFIVNKLQTGIPNEFKELFGITILISLGDIAGVKKISKIPFIYLLYKIPLISIVLQIHVVFHFTVHLATTCQPLTPSRENQY